MRKRIRAAIYILSAVFVPGGSPVAIAQTLPPTYVPQEKFNSGQDVVPSFDGWLRNPDRTFTMVFEYMNRNYQEELALPTGEANRVEPGPPDQGQPTHFLPRRHAWVFRVTVPADWGQKESIWTITSHGRTEKAYATLRMEEELLERTIMSRGNLSPSLDRIEPVPAASTGTLLTLTALVTDDGLPKARVPKARPEVEPGKAQTNSAVQGVNGSV
jgi:hypothetical protein